MTEGRPSTVQRKGKAGISRPLTSLSTFICSVDTLLICSNEHRMNPFRNQLSKTKIICNITQLTILGAEIRYLTNELAHLFFIMPVAAAQWRRV